MRSANGAVWTSASVTVAGGRAGLSAETARGERGEEDGDGKNGVHGFFRERLIDREGNRIRLDSGFRSGRAER